MKLGSKIRSRRRQLGLTLDAVAQTADLSKPFLSQVERDKASPSITSLAKIARALGVSIQYFLTAPLETDTVQRADKLRFFSLDDSGKQYAALTGNIPDRQLEALLTRLPPHSTSEVTTHAGEEFFYVLQGAVTITLEGQEFEVRTGDSAHYQSTTPHLWENRGTIDTVLIWVGTPTLF